MDGCVMSNKDCDAGRWVLNEQNFKLTSLKSCRCHNAAFH